MKKYIAVDLGASNGRVIVGDLKSIDVINRFPSRPVRIKGYNLLGFPRPYG